MLCLLAALVFALSGWWGDSSMPERQYVLAASAQSASVADNFISNDQYSALQRQESRWKARISGRRHQHKDQLRERRRGIAGVFQARAHFFCTQFIATLWPPCLSTWFVKRYAIARPAYYIYLFRYALF